MAITSKKQLGDLGEKAAAKYLQNQGYKILDMNYQNNTGRRLGEIDIVAQDKDEIVFVEVKAREDSKYKETLPEENITYAKLKKLSKIAQNYLKQKRLEDRPYRFDAVSVWINSSSKKAQIKHIISL